jgi:hypothetical protein
MSYRIGDNMYKALKTFGGVVSMAEGEVKDISDPTVVKDLVKAGYIEEVKPAEGKAKKTAKEDKE